MAEREKPRLIRVQMVDKDGKPIGVKTIRADEIRTDGPRKPLTQEQRGRAEKMYPLVRQMYPVTLEKWFAGFERDQNPDREMDVWDRIIRLADRLWQHEESKAYKRKQVDDTILGVSGNAVDIPALVGVSDEFVAFVRKMYSEEMDN